MLKIVRLSIPICFLAGLLYARSAAGLQPLFLIPATILAGAAVCYLWKTVVQTSLLPYAAHASVLGGIWALFLLYHDSFVAVLPSVLATIALYVCLTLIVLFLIHRLCRRVRPSRKWAATLLALYPASLVIVTLTVKEATGHEEHEPTSFRFGAVIERINVKGLSLPYQTYRYHTSKRTVETADLTIQSVYLSVDAPTQTLNTAFLEVVQSDGEIRYAMPRTVHFDNESFISEGETIDAQLVIITHGKQPYDWDVFYSPL